MWGERWRLPQGPHRPSCSHLKNTLERKAEHAGCPAQLKATAASSLTCWTVPAGRGPLDPFPRPPSVLCDPSLCPLDDLVEKKPCSWNSSRVCECRAGMFCATTAINSCARCFPHSVCPTGMIVKFPGKYPTLSPGPRPVLMPPPPP